MGPRRPKDPFGAELRRFAENIDIHQFRPLSAGIGLGHVTRPDPTEGLQKPYSQGHKNDPYAPPEVSSEPERSATAHATSIPLRRLFPSKEVVLPQPDPHMRPVEQASDSHTPRDEVAIHATDHNQRNALGLCGRLIRRVLGHGIDIFTVVVSVVAALFVGGWFLAPEGSNFLVRVLSWTPVAELTRLSLLELLVGVYVLFGLYWAFFKLMVGFTVGQGMFRLASNRKPSHPELTEDLPS